MEAKFIYHKDKINLNIKSTDTVQAIKEKLSYELGQLATSVHLKYHDRLLEDEEVLQKAITDQNDPVVIECDDDFSDDDEDDGNELVNTENFELNPQSEFEIPSYTPDDFEVRVKDLKELTGAEEDKCRQALRLAFFNADRAAEYLLTGEDLPERPTILPYANSENNYKPMPDRSQSRALKDFTDEQIETLQKIMNETNTDFSTAIQVFVACDKDKENTINILKGK